MMSYVWWCLMMSYGMCSWRELIWRPWWPSVVCIMTLREMKPYYRLYTVKYSCNIGLVTTYNYVQNQVIRYCFFGFAEQFSCLMTLLTIITVMVTLTTWSRILLSQKAVTAYFKRKKLLLFGLYDKYLDDSCICTFVPENIWNWADRMWTS